jgi:hypothetical protein
MFFVIAADAINAACGESISSAQDRYGNHGGGRENKAHNNLSFKTINMLKFSFDKYTY